QKKAGECGAMRSSAWQSLSRGPETGPGLNCLTKSQFTAWKAARVRALRRPRRDPRDEPRALGVRRLRSGTYGELLRGRKRFAIPGCVLRDRDAATNLVEVLSDIRLHSEVAAGRIRAAVAGDAIRLDEAVRVVRPSIPGGRAPVRVVAGASSIA